MLTVVIPTLNEAGTLPALLADLGRLDVSNQIVVADGGSRDGTAEVAQNMGAIVVSTARGRATQMNHGADSTRADWLLFLHADARLPTGARQDLRTAVTRRTDLQAAVWRLRIASSQLVFRFIELGAEIRDRVFGLPYGDQGLLIRRKLFEAVGGFREMPVMEDVAMVKAIRTKTQIYRFRSTVVVSSRRWDRDGPIRSSLRNLMLISAYFAGVPPNRLTGFYRPES